MNRIFNSKSGFLESLHPYLPNQKSFWKVIAPKVYFFYKLSQINIYYILGREAVATIYILRNRSRSTKRNVSGRQAVHLRRKFGKISAQIFCESCNLWLFEKFYFCFRLSEKINLESYSQGLGPSWDKNVFQDRFFRSSSTKMYVESLLLKLYSKKMYSVF